MYTANYRLVSSMEKCFTDTEVTALREWKAASALRGEAISFSLAFRGENPALDSHRNVFVHASAPWDVKMFSVEQVPVRFPAYKKRYDANYLRTEPGLYPDLLRPIDERESLSLVYHDTQSVLFTVCIPADAPAGTHAVDVSVTAEDGQLLFSDTFTVEVIPALLPPQTLTYTEWFHGDCLADYYRIPVFSEEHWRIMENFIRTAVENGINMILTPIVTPPLDTAVGGERTTIQLLDIRRDAGVWSFDFTRLGRFIDMLDRCGVQYIEICHLFTQWGAAHAPKVIATVDGVETRVFGWDTDALGEEYRSFLGAMLPALLAYLRDRGDADRCVFHVSDEPHLDHLEQYRAVRAILEENLPGCTIMDALSNFEFYKTGALDHPIPCTNHIEPFLDAGVPNLWTYYCCSQAVGTSNRFIAMPGARTRQLGAQLFKYNIAGFLQWGYNFYNSMHSLRHIDPYLISDGDYWVPAGDAFSVYPARDGTAILSLHRLHVTEGLRDLRALRLAESLLGHDAVVALIEEDLAAPLTFAECPFDTASLLAMRERVNRAIAEKI